MNQFQEYSHSSIGKKQIVALTGLILIGFVIVHLAGNLFIFGGPEVFNAYAKKLASLRPGLFVIEFVLLFVFLVHLYVTALLILQNFKARSIHYHVEKSQGERSLATRLMPHTGTIILLFVIWHMIDFTFVDHQGARSILKDGKSYGLYGVVYNAFSQPLHSLFYILAMIAVGLHLNHGIESFVQTFGFSHPSYFPFIKRLSHFLAFLVTVGYSTIPLFVLMRNSM